MTVAKVNVAMVIDLAILLLMYERQDISYIRE